MTTGRTAMAGVQTMQPKLMLFDEPTSTRDRELVGQVVTVMEDLAATGMAIIVVIDEMDFARAAADEVVFMSEDASSNKQTSAPYSSSGWPP
ncbi:hypothetical protein ACIQJT_35075 [Streptomyces sp. NPDC091972]|uniref:hypothetical protein n=1 Tax=Streptomyces sp. NPDC091972 TaxID=3366007 RepID=UPI003818F401